MSVRDGAFGLALASLLLTVSFATLADPLVVSPGSTVTLGDPAQPGSVGYTSLHVQPGGTLDLVGDLTIVVEGDITIDGTISATPKDKAPDGVPGKDGDNGDNDQPTGKNVGLSGAAAGTAPGWTARLAPRLELRSGGTVTINGTIRVEPAYDGGDGGKGGKGGEGGTGSSPEPGKLVGAVGGGGSQGGGGGTGGHAGLGGASVRITGDQIVLGPTGNILLDNQGVGGKGGAGGAGGHGARGGNGIDSGNGGAGGLGAPPGGGGRGGQGGNGGDLYLTAGSITLQGRISLQGGQGGMGGDAGTPGNGGAGGPAGPPEAPGTPGGRGGNAGNSFPLGFRGGDGGRGGNGGQLIVRADQWINTATIQFDGGEGGAGGAGVAAGKASGGMGGSPDGESGEDSAALDAGSPGQPGSEGRLQLWLNWPPNVLWVVSNPVACLEPFVESADGITVRRGATFCAGHCISSFIDTSSEDPFELLFDYRFVASPGTVTFRLGDQVLYTLEAPPAPMSEFESVRVFLDDPALQSPFLNRLEICITSDGGPVVQLANVDFHRVHPSDPPLPILAISSTGSGAAPTLTWTSAVGFNYQVQKTSSLTDGAWTAVGAVQAGTGADLTAPAEVAEGEGQAFYRVAVEPGP